MFLVFIIHISYLCIIFLFWSFILFAYLFIYLFI